MKIMKILIIYIQYWRCWKYWKYWKWQSRIVDRCDRWRVHVRGAAHTITAALPKGIWVTPRSIWDWIQGKPKILNTPQSGRSWQPFGEGKKGHKNFRQARICYFRDKCVVFARNRKFTNLTPSNMQYIPCISALLAKEELFLTQKGFFFGRRFPKHA